MNKFSIEQVAGVGLIVVLLLGALLNRLLFHSYHKGKDKVFKNLSSYFPIFKKGWQVVYKNLWLFWILFGFRILASLQQTLIQYSYFKSTGSPQPFFALPKISFWVILFKNFKERVFSFLMVSPHYLSIGSSTLISIILFLLILLLTKHFRRFLSKPFSFELRPSVNFLRENFWFFVIANILLLLYYDFFPIFPKNLGGASIFQFYIIPLSIYWAIITNALLVGFILTLFKKSIEEKEIRKGPIFTSSLKFFKPLFFFYLIFALIVFALSVPSFICHQLMQVPFRLHKYFISSISLFYIFFLLVPYLVVVEDVDWKTAFRDNFVFWRRRFPQLLILILLLILFINLINFLLCPLIYFNRTPFFLVRDVIRGGITTLFGLWITAVILLFCLKEK